LKECYWRYVVLQRKLVSASILFQTSVHQNVYASLCCCLKHALNSKVSLSRKHIAMKEYVFRLKEMSTRNAALGGLLTHTFRSHPQLLSWALSEAGPEADFLATSSADGEDVLDSVRPAWILRSSGACCRLAAAVLLQ
jgi:hypothetical protein